MTVLYSGMIQGRFREIQGIHLAPSVAHGDSSLRRGVESVEYKKTRKPDDM